MRNPLVILVLCLCSLTNAVPLGLKKNMAIVQEQEDPMLVMAEDEETRPDMMISRLNLPSNATSIRADITDGFSCDNKTYGYYADVENECQIFHVCLPVTYADGKENTFRWSFICPEETVFSQEYFTCMRSEDMSIDCEESFKYYELNRNFGMIEPEQVPADEVEEEMIMEDMSRQPPSQGDEEIKVQSIEPAPVKKQTVVKVQNSNRRKTQANRVTIDAQRKKVQPLRRLPKPAVVSVSTTTAKPVEEESPILEQEVERTTLKYQRLTKRPIAVIPEQPKPEESKPEKEVVRLDLFAQKRKRPQIFFPTRFDAAVQTDAEQKPLPYLKTDILPQKPVEPVVQNQAEAQAQASEITEVSIKPQVDLKLAQPQKIETSPVQKKEPAFVYIPVKEEEDQPIVEIKPEIDPLPEKVLSRVEVVETPIQKLDEPLMAEGSAVLAKIPDVAAPEESKPMDVEPIKGGEEEIPAEDIILKKIIAQTEKKVESEKPKDDEKTPLDPVLEPELVSLDEPEQSLKSADFPKPVETVNIEENIKESKIPEEANLSDDIPLEKLEDSLDDTKSETLLKLETPIAEEKPQAPLGDSKPEDLLKTETLVQEPSVAEVPIPDKLQEPQMALKINVPAPEVPEPEAENPKDLSENPIPEVPELEAEKPKDLSKNPTPVIPESEAEKPKDLLENPKPAVTEAEVSETQPDKPLNVEAPAPEPQMLLKSEIPEVKPIEQLTVEVPVSEISLKVEAPVPEIPSVVETPAPQLNMQLDIPTPNLNSMEKQEKPAEVEKSSANEEITKISETIPDAKVELPIQTDSKPLESLIEPIKEVSPELKLSSEIQDEKSIEALAEEKVQEAQLNGEKEIVQSATDNEEAQSLILDFISSLVNSENSNFEEQSAIVNEMSADSLPEASIAEPVIAAEAAEPTNIQSQDDQINPLYIPMMSSNDQMYQIPVQVIESPEPEPEPVVAAPVAGEPKLPLSVDDVVELVKESLDTPVEKDNIVEKPSNDEPNPQPDSEEVKPIYHRYIELGSNLLKSEALTASDDEPVVVPTENEKSNVEKEESSPELPKTSEKLIAEPEQLALKPSDSQSEVQAIQTEKISVEDKLIESPKEGRSLNRFKMDPRKRRFLFRSDAS